MASLFDSAPLTIVFSDGVPKATNLADTVPYFAPQSSRVDRAEIDTHGRTDPGRGRERYQDQFVIARLSRHTELEHTSLPADTSLRMWAGTEGRVLAVADGGGGRDGSVASTIVLQAMLEHVIHNVSWPGEDRASIDEIVLQELGRGLGTCAARLGALAESRGAGGRAPGLALTLAYLVWPTMYLLHVGESRCYLYRSRTLMRLTGERDGPCRWSTSSRLREVLQAGATAGREAELGTLSVRRGDTIVLCSDGLTTGVSDEAIARELDAATSARDATHRLMEAAHRVSRPDHVTMIAARL